MHCATNNPWARVTMSHLNFLRVTNLFYCTDLLEPIKLSTAQALAYAVICAHMRVSQQRYIETRALHPTKNG
jgi:hypothetical protein